MFNLTRGEELTALIAVSLVGLATAVVCFVGGDRGTTEEVPLNKSQKTAVQRSSGEAKEKSLAPSLGQARGTESVRPRVGPTSVPATGSGGGIAPGRFVSGQGQAGPGAQAPAVGPKAPGTSGSVKINVNVADQRQLESLPGIGPTLARRIIEFRQKQKFREVDDLLAVNGIGPKTLEKIRDLVSVE